MVIWRNFCPMGALFGVVGRVLGAVVSFVIVMSVDVVGRDVVGREVVG